MAARATFALKAGEWFRRGRLLMVSPVHGNYRRCQAEIPLIVLSRFPRPALVLLRFLWRYLNLLGVAQGTRWLAIRVGDRFRIVSGVRCVKPPGTQHLITMRVGGSSDP